MFLSGRRFWLRPLAVPVLMLWTVGAAALCRAIDDSQATQRILQDVKYLASDELEGRGVGTEGIDRAADYIRKQFQAVGLKPLLPDSSYFQNFETPNGSELGEPNRLVIETKNRGKRTLAIRKDFVPLAISGAGSIDAPLAFAGYGITAPKAHYDDFSEFDAAGKAVIVLDRGPGQKPDPHEPADPHAAISSRLMDLKQKVSNAASHGATAVLWVRTQDEDKLMEFGEQADFRVAKIPAVQITRATADALIKPTLGKTLAELQSAIDSDMKSRSCDIEDVHCRGEITVRQRVAPIKNVIASLDAMGPHAEETIVVGAHYDHLGYGEVGSMLPGTHEIHNGADDNASGTAGILELARRLSRRGALPRRVLFAAFTAEERGLIGSDYYVKNPAVPLEKTVAMINLDMIGRLRNDKLIVEGVGTAADFRPLVESLSRPFGFNLKPVASGLGPSDQTSFCFKKIPVLFFWTDYHPDYHKPSDDWDKISTDGMDRVLSLVEECIVALAGMEQRPAFVEVAVPSNTVADSTGERAYLGTIPAFGEEVDGVLLSGVTTGAPAEVAGIRGGDVIVHIGELAVHNLQDMQNALETHRPGDRIKITVRRGDNLITYPVTLGRRK